jgi:hypothetical protein
VDLVQHYGFDLDAALAQLLRQLHRLVEAHVAVVVAVDEEDGDRQVSGGERRGPKASRRCSGVGS